MLERHELPGKHQSSHSRGQLCAISRVHTHVDQWVSRTFNPNFQDQTFCKISVYNEYIPKMTLV